MSPLRFAPAAERNGEAVLAALVEALDGVAPGALVLELGAGTGQHVCRFARALPAFRFLPTERPEALADLAARVRAEGTPNILAPRALDVRTGPWPDEDAALCHAANVVHMMEDADIDGLFRGAAARLAPGGRLGLYGPFAIDGRHTGEGNRAFDAALRARAPATGLRDLADLDALARDAGLEPAWRREMPSDNRFVVWTRADGASRQSRSDASSASATPRA